MNTFHTIAGIVLLTAAGLAGSSARACARPLQQSGVVQVPAGVMNGIAYINVPRAYRYEVQYVSAGIRLQSASEYSDFNVGVIDGADRIDFELPSLPGYTPIDRKTSGQVTFYADPGSRVGISVVRGNASVSTTGTYAISGCLRKVN